MALPREQIKEAVETAAFGGPLEDPDIPGFDLIPQNFFGMCELYPDERELWESEDFDQLVSVLEEVFGQPLRAEVDAARVELVAGQPLLRTVSLSDELSLYIRDNGRFPDGKQLLLALCRPGWDPNE